MHLNCPHCRNPIEVVELPEGEVLCPSCGSSFHLTNANTTVEFKSAEHGQMFGRFAVQQQVGMGAFGTVYKAVDGDLHRTVALKVPRASNIAPSKAGIDRFLREARSAAQLRHPSIVTVHEVGVQNDQPYLVSDFVDGVTLADWLTAHEPTFRQAAQWIAELAEALHYAHTQGVIHRDVKPSNIMLAKIPECSVLSAEKKANNSGLSTQHSGLTSQHLYLMDFGLAKRDAGEITMTMEGQVLGTPAYMSPEQARGEGHAVDGRADEYSLGVIFYELLTGELPFRGNVRMLMDQVLHEEAKSPRKINDRIPLDLETICLKAMAKEPGCRYASCAELAADLRRYLHGEPIMARPVGRLERGWRWCKRNPALATATSLSILGLITVAILSIAFAVHNSLAAERITQEQVQTLAEQVRTKNALNDSEARRREAAWLALSQGRNFCEQGKIAEGMLWFARSLEIAPTSHLDLQRVIRLNLPMWNQKLGNLKLKAKYSHRINGIAVSADGKKVLTAFQDSIAQLWDAETRASHGLPWQHPSVVWCAAFSPDGKTAITGCADGIARLWEVATGKMIDPPFRHHQGRVYAVAFSPDGQRVVTGSSDKTALIWDIKTRKVIVPALNHDSAILDVVFSTDGLQVGTACDNMTAHVWDASTGKPKGHKLKHQDEVSSIAFSTDGKTVITGSLDKTAKIWDLSSGNLLTSPLRHSSPVMEVAFSKDDKTVLTSTMDFIVQKWETANGNLLQTVLQAPSTTLNSKRNLASFGSDRNSIVLADSEGSVYWWQFPLEKPGTVLLPHQDYVTAVAFSSDGQRLVTGCRDGMVRLWSKVNGKVELQIRHGGFIGSVGFSTDEKVIFSSGWDGAVHFWNAISGARRGSLPNHHGAVSSVVYSPNGKTLLSCANLPKAAYLWDAVTLKPQVQPLQHDDWVETAVYSPDGQLIATGSSDKTVRLWHADSGKPFGSPMVHPGRIVSVAFSSDGKIVLGAGFPNTVHFWDVATGKHTGTVLHHSAPVRKVEFSPDGSYIVTGSEDGTARLWDAETGVQLGPPMSHMAAVRSVAISPDGKAVLTGSFDHTACLWPVAKIVNANVSTIMLWTQVITGMEIDEKGVIRSLEGNTWRIRRQQLEKSGFALQP